MNGGKEISGRHTDLRGCRSESTFRLAHIRSAADQALSVADRDEEGDSWWRDALLQLSRRIRRGAAEECRQLEKRCLTLAFELRNAGADLCDQRLCARQVELRARSGIKALPGDLGFVAHDIERTTGDHELLAKRADRTVGARRVRRDQHSHTVASRGHRFGIGTCGFDGAVDATEEIDLVSDPKEILVQRDRLRRPSSELENLIRDWIAPRTAAADTSVDG